MKFFVSRNNSSNATTNIYIICICVLPVLVKSFWIPAISTTCIRSSRSNQQSTTAITRTIGFGMTTANSENDNDSSSLEEQQENKNSNDIVIPIDEKFVLKTEDDINALTDRFKYKVHALMGTYDPPAGGGGEDTDRVGGTILSAIMNFPTEYTFTVIGKTNGDDSLISQYVNDVTRKMLDTFDDLTQDKVVVEPRGKKFTRVTVSVTVHSATSITSTYEELANIELTIMRY